MNYDRVDELLAEKGMSRRQLAIEAGISIDTMSSWFRRKTRNIPEGSISAIADALGVTPLSITAHCGRVLDVDAEIERQEAVMRETYESKESNPNDFLRYSTARAIKVYLLDVYARQQGTVLRGVWIARGEGEEICSVCWLPRRISELSGKCVGCGATMAEAPKA